MAQNNNDRMNAYAPIERASGKGTIWIRVGVAFVNRDGNINVYLDAMPLTGRLQLRHESGDDGQASDR